MFNVFGGEPLRLGLKWISLAMFFGTNPRPVLLLDNCLRLFKTIPTGFPGSETCIEGGSIQVRLPEGYVHVE